MVVPGMTSVIDLGTCPVNPCRTGVMPRERSRARICLSSVMWESIQLSGSGPSRPSMFAIQPHGKYAGPTRKSAICFLENPKSLRTCRQTASCPVTARGALMPFSAIQSIIAWMALKGINAPLAVTGQEAVWRQVLSDFGFSRKQIADFLVGPAYFPWGWMANIDGLGGPLPDSWIDSHITLERQIL